MHIWPLIIISSFLFLCGFTTTLNDSIIPYLQDKMQLSYKGIMLIQLAFYLGYFSAAPMAVILLNKLKHKKTIVLSIAGGAIGCTLLVLGSQASFYPFILAAIYVLGSSIATLQVSGNAYAMMLGDEKTAASRLTFVQSFTAVGMISAPLFGAAFILSDNTANSTNTIYVPYIAIALTWCALALIASLIKIPSAKQLSAINRPAKDSGLSSTIIMGFFAIFAYVGAEVAVGSFLVKFLQEPEVGGLLPQSAGRFTAVYWGGVMVGRFIGSYSLKHFQPARILLFHSTAAILLVLTGTTMTGNVAMWSMLLVGLCNSIMFPTIFSLAMGKIGVTNTKAAGILTMGNIGGALVPMLQGAIADDIGLQISFMVPAFCFLYIILFSLNFLRTTATQPVYQS